MASYAIKPVKKADFEKWLSALILASKLRHVSSNNTSLESGPAPNVESPHTSVDQINDFQGAVLAQNTIISPECHPPVTNTTSLFPSVPRGSRHFSPRTEKDVTLFDYPESDNETHPTPPPRPRRTLGVFPSVNEQSNLIETDAAVSKRFPNIPSEAYPDSGLAKRMSVSASDFRGKSRDELMLLLLQLNREKANLHRWRKYFLQRLQLLSDPNNEPANQDEISAIQVELNDVLGQLALSEPLVVFLSNMLRMGDLYAGDDTMFASEYNKHLLEDHEFIPSKSGLAFARDLEAREIARTLNASVREVNGVKDSRSITRSTLNNSLMGWLDNSQESLLAQGDPYSQTLNQSIPQATFQETAEKRRLRLRLESELADLENICQPHKALHHRLRDVQKYLRKRTVTNPVTPVLGRLEHRGPSAALLSRLRSSGNEHRHASRSNERLDRFHGDELSMTLTSTGHTDSRRQHTGAGVAKSDNFGPSGVPGSLQRFRSIPENLNVISQSADQGTGVDSRQQKRSLTSSNKQMLPKPEPRSSVKNTKRLQSGETEQLLDQSVGPVYDNSRLTTSLRQTSEVPPRAKDRTSDRTLPSPLSRSGLSQDNCRASTQYRNPPCEALNESSTEDLSLDDMAVKGHRTLGKPSADSFRHISYKQQHGSGKTSTPNTPTLRSWQTRQLH